MLHPFFSVAGCTDPPLEVAMAEILNLRSARKRALRQDKERKAAANRVAHGVPAAERKAQAALRDTARHSLDLLKIDKEDGH